MFKKLIPHGADVDIAPIFVARALRGFADGFVAVLLPVYLLAIGFGGVEVGAIATATLLGSACATLAIGAWGHRWTGKALTVAAALLMVATGLGFASIQAFWPMLLVAFVGTLNPSSGDVSIFLPLEHARLAAASDSAARTDLFARYALTGALCAAIGSLASGIPDRVVAATGVERLLALRGMFMLYGIIGLAVWRLYGKLPNTGDSHGEKPAPLNQSRIVVIKLAALFSVDSFAGGLVLNSLLSLWLFQRFGLSLAATGAFFFASGLLGAVSQLAAPQLAKRIGLVNTMVFTHIPASLCLIGAAFAPYFELALVLLLVRALVSSMDVPARSAFVMSVVQPHERAAAASFTAVPRSLASALSPVLAGWLFQSGWAAAPLVACGVLKIAYDLALWRAFRLFKH
ncbi:MFS transporter [Rhodoferax sp. GW822-FHT02A01]|uniref:MFS transporter n=1 Tax=Rhodoferax sp. GW822-FHT02A01 TaxID=3141537 RepID=UPI00315D65AA